MRNAYTIRNAIPADKPFLATAIIAAEKGNSDICALCRLFDLTEAELETLLPGMIDAENETGEFSLTSFLIAEHEGRPVGAVAGWVEAVENAMPSGRVKANLIQFFFPKESLIKAYAKSIANDLKIDRSKNTLQVEYLYVAEQHRSMGIAASLISELVRRTEKNYPGVKRAELQVFKNNSTAIRLYENLGFTLRETVISFNDEITRYFPCNEKLLLEKMLNTPAINGKK
jgi:ribosomal protein S18 acetylase RimI-like enzyme